MNAVDEGKLSTRVIGRQIRYYHEIDSTNLEAKRFQTDEKNNGMVFVCEQQNAGRGRMGKSWVSQEGTGLWFSILLMPEIEPSKASMITLLAALAAADAVKECTGLSCFIKWPNDLVLNGKKMCGILTEMSTRGEKIQAVIVGIGINVNMEQFPKDIEQKATSLKIEGGRQYSREDILAVLLNHFERYYDDFCQCGNLKKCMDSYNFMLINKGKKVKIIENENSFEGEALGVDEFGHLLIKKEDGAVDKITSGEVSVRGLYGYV